jgi:hypothetical protein
MLELQGDARSRLGTRLWVLNPQHTLWSQGLLRRFQVMGRERLGGMV